APSQVSYERRRVMQVAGGGGDSGAEFGSEGGSHSHANGFGPDGVGFGANGQAADHVPPADDLSNQEYASQPGGSSAVGKPLPGEIIRTAVCVEPRQGVLHVFMPPLEFAE